MYRRLLELLKLIKPRQPCLPQTNVRSSLPLTNKKLWEMAKVITDKQKAAKEQPTDKVDWDMIEEMWFDWLEEELFGNDAYDMKKEIYKICTQLNDGQISVVEAQEQLLLLFSVVGRSEQLVCSCGSRLIK